MTRERMLEAREHILNKRYSQARAILNTIDHPKAREWLEKLDKVELGDPFWELARAQAVPTSVSPIQPITPPRNTVQAKRLLESTISTFLQNNWRLNYSTENMAQIEKKQGVDGCLAIILVGLFAVLGSAIVCLMIASSRTERVTLKTDYRGKLQVTISRGTYTISNPQDVKEYAESIHEGASYVAVIAGGVIMMVIYAFLFYIPF